MSKKFHVERYNSDFRRLWDDFIVNSKNGWFLFQRDFMEYHADRFCDHSLVVLNEKNSIVAILPAHEIKERNCVKLYSHNGLTFGGLLYNNKTTISEVGEILNNIFRYCEETNIRELNIKVIPFYYHISPAQEDLYFLLNSSAEVTRCDVSSVIDLRSDFKIDRSRRRGEKHALLAGLTVRRTDDIEKFMRIVECRLNEKYDVSATHKSNELRYLMDKFPENIFLLGVYTGTNKMIAGGLFFKSQSVMTAQYIFANQEDMNLHPIDMLVSDVLQNYCHGLNYFNYGISTVDEGKQLNLNLISKKEGFGARAVTHLHLKKTFLV